MKYNNFKVGDILLIRDNSTGLQSLAKVFAFSGSNDVILEPFRHSAIHYTEPNVHQIYCSENPESTYFESNRSILGVVLNASLLKEDTEEARTTLLKNIHALNDINDYLLNPVEKQLDASQFTLTQLQSHLSEEVFISTFEIGYNTMSGIDIDQESLRKIYFKAEDLLPIYQGNENMYFRLKGHALSNGVPFEISIFSKENHIGLLKDYISLVELNVSQSTIVGALYPVIVYAHDHQNTVLMQSIIPLLPNNYKEELTIIHDHSSRFKGFNEEQTKDSFSKILQSIQNTDIFEPTPIVSYSVSYHEGIQEHDITGKNYSTLEFQDHLKNLYLSRYSNTYDRHVYFEVQLENNQKLKGSVYIGDHPGTYNPYKQDLLNYIQQHPFCIHLPPAQTHKIIQTSRDLQAKCFLSRSTLIPSILLNEGKEAKVEITFFGSRSSHYTHHSDNLNLYELYDGTRKIALGSDQQLKQYVHTNNFEASPQISPSMKALVLSEVSDPHLFGEKISYKLYAHTIDDKDRKDVHVYSISTTIDNASSLLNLHEKHSYQANLQQNVPFEYNKANHYEQVFFQLLNKVNTYPDMNSLIYIWEDLKKDDQIALINLDRGTVGNDKLKDFLHHHAAPLEQMTLHNFIVNYSKPDSNFYDPKTLAQTIKDNFQQITGKKQYTPSAIPNEPIVIELLSHYKHDIPSFKNAWTNGNQNKDKPKNNQSEISF